MNLTKEQLLAPRIIVMADYPFSPYTVGEIVALTNYFVLAKLLGCSYTLPSNEDLCRLYPKVFRLLEWWEYREISDLPTYVKVVIPHQKLEQGCIRAVSSWAKTKLGLRGDSFPCYLTIDWVTPATEIEYKQYKTPQL